MAPPPGRSEATRRGLPRPSTQLTRNIHGTPCAVHVGPDGAGHFVKMVHNSEESSVFAGQRHHDRVRVSNSSASHRTVSYRPHLHDRLAA
ncbi:hypothetical protein EKH77_29200 [Streptomyces luteoverticillatus]|uniref:Uncharacterized protein n=1 Tax=Streptomyces luteoverticillatus TaxID=66425 RepID=A0A3S9PQU9_STRLT|nr:hypothetical protein EKH77_29200 [Streptomyces luteoverticillatus]